MQIEFPGGAIRRYQRYASGRDETAATIYFEVAPDPDDRILAAKWKRLPDHSKHIITRRAALVVVPKALAAFELEGELDEVVGGYLGETNPCMSIRLTRGAQALELAKFLGHVCIQQSIMVTSDGAQPGLEEVDLVSIALPGGSTVWDIASLYDRLWRVVWLRKLVSGHTTRCGEMRIMNMSGLSTRILMLGIRKSLKGKYEVRQSKVYAACIDKESYYERQNNGQEQPTSDARLASERSNYLRWKVESILKVGLAGERTDCSGRIASRRSRRQSFHSKAK